MAMFRFPIPSLRAAAIVISTLMATAAAVPASAQISVSIGYDNFHNRLAPYGTWSHNARWGEVWHPTRVERNFRPYYNGHWEDTREYGWLWVSDESWGDVPYHYGRWVHDPREGWLWVPGYVWGPSWVVWRSGGGNIGWFPMPPGDDYYGDGAYRDRFNDQYGYRDWYGSGFSNDQFLSLWVFVGEDHFRDREFRNYAVPQRNYSALIGQTRDTTSYTTVNNYVVNRSIDTARLQRDTKQRFEPVAAASVIGRNAVVTQANVGRKIEQRERKARPIPVNINPAAQGIPSRTNDRNQGRDRANPQTERAAPAVVTPQKNSNQRPERGDNRDAGAKDQKQAPPQTEHAAPAATLAPKADQRRNDNQRPKGVEDRGSKPETNDAGSASPQAVHGPSPVISPPAPQRHGAQVQDGKAIVQDTKKPERANARVPASTDAAGDAPGNPKRNQARDAKADEAKAADENNGGNGKQKNDRGRD